ncbi:MAG TPA: hypothetical protein VKG44_04985, partial [Candidatus Baltobacteraceae bacterium]|nr:hypothetical protein [Candidatus Baltobacteraceae bacterium]
AYALFKPSDPQYAEVAALTVELATTLHYDPLTNDDAALWYVREAAAWVGAHGDATQAAKAAALAARLSAGSDPAILAGQAEEDAAANVRTFHGQGETRVATIVADVRAYNLTQDKTYRTLLLQHAADPALRLASIPNPESDELFGLTASVLSDPSATEAERANARAIAARRAHAAQQNKAPQVSRELSLMQIAPADEYFGEIRISPVGIKDETLRISKYLDAGWGEQMAPDALRLAAAVEDWQRQYPHDRTLPKYLSSVYKLLVRVAAPATLAQAEAVKALLVVQYADSYEARALAAS